MTKKSKVYIALSIPIIALISILTFNLVCYEVCPTCDGDGRTRK